jgi:WD40 repeat protein
MGKLLLALLAASASAQTLPGDHLIRLDANVSIIAFSADGKLLAGACDDGTIKFWDAQSGALSRTVTWSKNQRSVAFSSGAGMVASSGQEKVINLWDLKSGELTRQMAGNKKNDRPPGVFPRWETAGQRRLR